ncbi:unnamed protein product [Cyprideis torosa]|uniref:Pecanex-like protein n=1 Tax=Cyprideis torosa TaxID=163714 RepID=A0A7R8ZM51_9CRUS|nr:unnamed protein product [Cyprideis torosa]CAG0888107.1 unnamed protein product [Cyprideis torosa]
MCRDMMFIIVFLPQLSPIRHSPRELALADKGLLTDGDGRYDRALPGRGLRRKGYRTKMKDTSRMVNEATGELGWEEELEDCNARFGLEEADATIGRDEFVGSLILGKRHEFILFFALLVSMYESVLVSVLGFVSELMRSCPGIYEPISDEIPPLLFPVDFFVAVLFSVALVFTSAVLEPPLLPTSDEPSLSLEELLVDDFEVPAPDDDEGSLPLPLEPLLAESLATWSLLSVASRVVFGADCYDEILCATSAAEIARKFDAKKFITDFIQSSSLPFIDWITGLPELQTLLLKAFRLPVMDPTRAVAIVPLDEDEELDEALKEFEDNWFFGVEGSEEWEAQVLADVPHLFALEFNETNHSLGSHLCSLGPTPVTLFRLNPEAVRSLWANLSWELLYLTNDDEERYSVQAHPVILRNLSAQAADPPLGYPIFTQSVLMEL